MVAWLIGLSGAGKTTLGHEVCRLLREQGEKVVFLDGDLVREVFGHDLGYSLEDRRKNADRLSRLCAMLESQDLFVVCAVLALFPESLEWNRRTFRNYLEVFIDTPLESLVERDSKGLYKEALAGRKHNVAGVDLKFTPPSRPDQVIKNRGDLNGLLAHAPAIVDWFRAGQKPS